MHFITVMGKENVNNRSLYLKVKINFSQPDMSSMQQAQYDQYLSYRLKCL